VQPVVHEQAKILTSTKLNIEYETLSYVIPIQAWDQHFFTAAYKVAKLAKISSPLLAF
jgi:hypothetical protein